MIYTNDGKLFLMILGGKYRLNLKGSVLNMDDFLCYIRLLSYDFDTSLNVVNLSTVLGRNMLTLLAVPLQLYFILI